MPGALRASLIFLQRSTLTEKAAGCDSNSDPIQSLAQQCCRMDRQSDGAIAANTRRLPHRALLTPQQSPSSHTSHGVHINSL
jgi:hypothetical protein